MKPRDMSTLSLVTQLGFTVVTALVLSLLLGIWLDGVLNTKPWLTLAFSMFGIVVGMVGVYRLVTRAIEASVESTPRAGTGKKATGPADAADSASRQVDPWADDDHEEDREEDHEKDDWDRDPWKDVDAAAEKRRASQVEAERRLGLRPPSVKPDKAEEEQK